MPLYFAYGANMDRAAMAVRCPKSTPLGVARLMRHRLVIMPEGYASVMRDPRAVVHGVLWDANLADMRALDAFEEISRGLYRKIQQPVVRGEGVSQKALIYVGKGEGGRPRPGYMEGVIASARAWELPLAYVRDLERWLVGVAQSPEPPRATTALVRPRFATPFDRR